MTTKATFSKKKIFITQRRYTRHTTPTHVVTIGLIRSFNKNILLLCKSQNVVTRRILSG